MQQAARARTVSRCVEALDGASQRWRPRGAAAAAERRGQRRRACGERVAYCGHLRLARLSARSADAPWKRDAASLESAETHLVRQVRAIAGDELGSLCADGADGRRRERRDHRERDKERVKRRRIHEGGAGERGARPMADRAPRGAERARGEAHRKQRGAEADGRHLIAAPAVRALVCAQQPRALRSAAQAASARAACPDAPPWLP